MNGNLRVFISLGIMCICLLFGLHVITSGTRNMKYKMGQRSHARLCDRLAIYEHWRKLLSYGTMERPELEHHQGRVNSDRYWIIQLMMKGGNEYQHGDRRKSHTTLPSRYLHMATAPSGVRSDHPITKWIRTMYTLSTTPTRNVYEKGNDIGTLIDNVKEYKEPRGKNGTGLNQITKNLKPIYRFQGKKKKKRNNKQTTDTTRYQNRQNTQASKSIPNEYAIPHGENQQYQVSGRRYQKNNVSGTEHNSNSKKRVGLALTEGERVQQFISSNRIRSPAPETDREESKRSNTIRTRYPYNISDDGQRDIEKDKDI